jgi:hypothetical protein
VPRFGLRVGFDFDLQGFRNNGNHNRRYKSVFEYGGYRRRWDNHHFATMTMEARQEALDVRVATRLL